MYKSNTKLKNTNPWLYGLIGIGSNILLSIGIRTYIAEARYIPGEAMSPTLKAGDRLVVDKISYYFRDPERGEIIAFRAVDEVTKVLQLPEGDNAFIFRIIGLPGDTVEINNGSVFINGHALMESYIKSPPSYQWGPDVIPANSYLVLGDNRNSTYDGHIWGFLPRENIIGRSIIRFWPPDRVGKLG